MEINGIPIRTTLDRPRIPVSVATSTQGRSVLGNGSFGYDKYYDTRDFTFSTYDDIDKHFFDEVVLLIDGFEYHGTVTNVLHTYKTMNLVLTTVTILVQPFKYYPSSENKPITLGDKNTTAGTQTTTYKSIGIASEPIIEVFGEKSSEVVIVLGNFILRLASCPGYLKIDCRDYHLNVYDIDGNERNDLLLSDFPKLTSGINGVSMPFGIELKLTGNWREL